MNREDCHNPPRPVRTRQECSAEVAAQLCLFLLLTWHGRARLGAHGPLNPSTRGLNRRSARPSPCRPSPRAVHSQTSHSCLPFTASALWEKQYRVAMKKVGRVCGDGGGEGDADMRAVQCFSRGGSALRGVTQVEAGQSRRLATWLAPGRGNPHPNVAVHTHFLTAGTGLMAGRRAIVPAVAPLLLLRPAS
ncbi:hypothetical protein E2C01_061119 [Portunus trituberculatus]|uniref:Uncharacterized protein n=1 Tax=Portunus trituberculatus TaxID=210409 RepID=A0A5B7H4D3_PORTR|nr:hypothetical protein [Portunus trituberculatus]